MDGYLTPADVVLIARALVGHRVTLGPAPTPTPTPTPTPIPLPPLTMNYRIMVNDAVDWEARMNRAEYLTDSIKPLFRDVLNTNLVRIHASGRSSALNMRPGCRWPGRLEICISYTPGHPNATRCGNRDDGSDCRTEHHRSAMHFVTVLSVNYANTFRFVDYRLCAFIAHQDDTHPTMMNNPNGMADRVGGSNIIVSSRPEIEAQRKAIVHEISHLLGAWDDSCNSGQECVMRGRDRDIFDKWCNNCIRDIASHRR